MLLELCYNWLYSLLADICIVNDGASWIEPILGFNYFKGFGLIKLIWFKLN